MDYTLNPYNSRTRADGQGVRPDLLHLLGETVVTKQDMNSNLEELHQATADLAQAIDPEHPDSHLWLMNQRIEEEQNLALERHEELIAANAADIATIRPHVTRTLWLNLGVQSVENEYMRLYRSTATNGNPNVTWEIKSGWVGTFQVIGGVSPKSDTHFSDTNYMREYSAPGPQYTGFNSADGIGSVLVTINISPGTAHTTPLPIPNQNIGRDWQTLQSWTIPQDTEITAAAKLTFTNKTRIATYGLRIMVDGVNNTSSSASKAAPLFGHAPRVHSASMNVRRIEKGSVISLQAKADHSNSLNRHISNAQFDVTWIDNTQAAT